MLTKITQNSKSKFWSSLAFLSLTAICICAKGREATWLVDSRLGAHSLWVLHLINFSGFQWWKVRPDYQPLFRKWARTYPPLLGRTRESGTNQTFFLSSEHREGVSVLTSCAKSIQVPVLTYMEPPFLVPLISSSFQVWVWARTITSSSQRDRKSLNLPMEPLSRLKVLLEPNCLMRK